MSDESGDRGPASPPSGKDPAPPAKDPWGNPLPPGTVQQPPRSAFPPPSPAPPPPPAGQAQPGQAPAPVPGARPDLAPPSPQSDAFWPADTPPPSGSETDAWGQPVADPGTGHPPPGQPVYPGQAYPGQAGWGYARPKNAGNAIGSMVCGIFSLLCAGWIGIVLGPVAIGIGLAARRRIARSNGQLTGAGFALAGIILGSIGTVVSIASIAFLLANPDFVDDLLRDLTTTTSG